MTTAILITKPTRKSVAGTYSTSYSSSIFTNGKLKPGIYTIQNIYTETYLDIEIYSRRVVCRPAQNIGEGRGLVQASGLDIRYRGFYWGTEKVAWDLASANKGNGAPVVTYHESSTPWQMWRLAPAKVEGGFAPARSSFGTPEPGSLPSYK
ncbi:hypothetical protein BDM02DRAFT_2342586 [Thelephora ganbajun]|uniref:Uncharacterized protein n=1 Tax=Thelephora ganbajun TaxID=370292 RepID=A0ACB6ZF36_THEGA|nr:hypothetical protein BDM02DRAFT_2342586 [Thelephora ganbajun]